MPFLWLLLVGTVGVILFMPKTAWGYIAGQKVLLQLGEIKGGLFLERTAADAFNRMDADAKAAGVNLVPSGPRSAFRTEQMQAELIVERAEFAAPLNRSPHQAGKAIDVETAGGTNAAYKWLVANARKYGFHKTVEREPWHWEHLG
jgi:LAS superfamily LD-carboxypeptidase LdcB